MVGARKFLAVAVLVLPLASWITSNGGLPVCCWGGLECPNRASNHAACPMPSMGESGRESGRGSSRSCTMAPVEHLMLPAPAMPVFPVRAAVSLALAPVFRPLTPAPEAGVRAGWQAPIFHPPRLLAW